MTGFDFTAKTTDSLTYALGLYRDQYEGAIERGDLDIANYAWDVMNQIRDELARREAAAVPAAEGSDEALIAALAASPGFTTVQDSAHLAELLGMDEDEDEDDEESGCITCGGAVVREGRNGFCAQCYEDEHVAPDDAERLYRSTWAAPYVA